METMIRNIVVVIAAIAMTSESSALLINRSRRSADTCGVTKSHAGFIVRGQDFLRGSFPWIVALLHTGTRPPQFFCGGTLISNNFVISAAHCILNKGASDRILPRDIIAIFGAHDLNDPYESGRYQLSPKRIFIHDDWNHRTENFDADVSLLEFWANKIHFDDYIQPICLWDSANETIMPEGIVIGWGKSENLAKVHENVPKLIRAPIKSNEYCLPGEKSLAGLSSLRTFCAGLRNGSGVCFGDSGGGLFVKVGEVYHLKGIVSSSLIKDDGCDVSRYAVYTNVLEFGDWIRKMIGDALVSSNQAFKKVVCTLEMVDSLCCGELNSCSVNQAIDSESYVLASEINTATEQFHITDNKEVKFLPKQIGEKFRNLKECWVWSCGLTVVRNHYFKDMNNLRALNLYNNRITAIERDAFKDLISVTQLYLTKNMIETLHEKLFATMVKLQWLWINDNNLKLLSSTTLKIVGGNLGSIHLESNICIDEEYNSYTWNQLEADIRANCTR